MSGPILTASPREAAPIDAFLSRVDGVDLDAMTRAAVARQNTDLERARAVAEAAARIARTSDGQTLIEHLLDVTLRAPMTLEGASRDVGYDNALRRDGANGLMWTILRLVQAGAEPSPPQKGQP